MPLAPRRKVVNLLLHVVEVSGPGAILATMNPPATATATDLDGLTWGKEFASALRSAARQDLLVQDTIEITLEVWADSPTLPDLEYYEPTLLELLGSGVSARDVLAYLRATVDGPTYGPDTIARLVAENLRNLSIPYPDLGLRAAVQWVTLAARLGSPVLALIDEWADEDGFPIEHGWLYVAAGLTLAEVTAHPVSVEQAQVMAALRGPLQQVD